MALDKACFGTMSLELLGCVVSNNQIYIAFNIQIFKIWYVKFSKSVVNTYNKGDLMDAYFKMVDLVSKEFDWVIYSNFYLQLIKTLCCVPKRQRKIPSGSKIGNANI